MKEAATAAEEKWRGFGLKERGRMPLYIMKGMVKPEVAVGVGDALRFDASEKRCFLAAGAGNACIGCFEIVWRSLFWDSQ